LLALPEAQGIRRNLAASRQPEEVSGRNAEEFGGSLGIYEWF
jgi:hypothetical protein